MISDVYHGFCDVFLCYRDSGSETAKQFKKSLAKIKTKNFGYVWYSDQESVGDFKRDISRLIPSASYAILFITKDFTNGFLTSDGQNNYEKCITVQEIIEIEKRRQENKITVIAVHIAGYVLGDKDLMILETVFENERINKQESVYA
mgnify:CR=1 FL=1